MLINIHLSLFFKLRYAQFGLGALGKQGVQSLIEQIHQLTSSHKKLQDPFLRKCIMFKALSLAHHCGTHAYLM